MQDDEKAKMPEDRIDIIKKHSVLKKVFFYQIAAIITVALCCSVFFVYGFNKNRVPEIIQEQKVALKQQQGILKDTLNVESLKGSSPVDLEDIGLTRSELLRYPKGREVFLYKKGETVMKLFADPTGIAYRTRKWQPDIRMYDEAKGAIYIATETGQLLFSNIKIDNFLTRNPVKEYFDSGVSEGVRIYQNDGSGVVAGFSRVKGTNLILFFENPLFGVKSKLKSIIFTVLLGALVAAMIVAVLSFLSLSKLSAPFQEAKRLAYAVAMEEPQEVLSYEQDPDFGVVLQSLQLVQKRMQFYSSEHVKLMERLRLIQTSMDRIRSSSSTAHLLSSWLNNVEKVIEHDFETVDFYQLDPDDKSQAICSRLKGKASSKAMHSDRDDVITEEPDVAEATLIQFEAQAVGTLEKVDSPQIVDSVLLLLRENQIAEKNGFHYLVGHQAKWVMTLKPFPDLSQKPAYYLSLSVLASSLDLKLHSLSHQHPEEISILNPEEFAS